MTRKPVGKLLLKAAGLFLLAVFLQWAGMPNPIQEGTIYSEVGQLLGAGAHAGRAG
jgi:hypothetical protein